MATNETDFQSKKNQRPCGFVSNRWFPIQLENDPLGCEQKTVYNLSTCLYFFVMNLKRESALIRA